MKGPGIHVKKKLEREVGGLWVPIQPCSKTRKFNFQTYEDEQVSDPDILISISCGRVQVYKPLVEHHDEFSDPLQSWEIYSFQFTHLAHTARNMFYFPASSECSVMLEKLLLREVLNRTEILVLIMWK